MKIAVLHNPTAGVKELSRKKLLRLLREAGYHAEYFSTKADEWEKRGAFAGAHFLVAAGGDGTVRKAALRVREEELPLAPIPLGTANNICTSLGIHGAADKIIAGWAAGRKIRMNLGLARGPWGERIFVEGAGVGLLGRVMTIMAAIKHASDHEFEEREDMVHHGAAITLALAHEVRPAEVEITLGARKRPREEVLLCEVLNINRAGSGLELAPRADVTDGTFDVVIATARQRERLTRHLMRCVGDESRGARIASHRARHVRFRIRDADFRIDDQVVLRRTRGETPRSRRAVTVSISVLPDPIEVMLPAHSSSKTKE